MKRMPSGLTLIELMIVIATIAVLVALAQPAYQDYVTRSQATEAISLATEAEQAVAEHFSNSGSFAGTDNTTLGLAQPGSISGRYIRETRVVNGVVTTTFNNAGSSILAGRNIVMSPTDTAGTVKWTCRGSVPERYRPSVCR